MSFESFLVGLLVGLVVGGVFILYAVAPRLGTASVPTSESLDEMLRTQIAYQQSQNMMRGLQLEQARQESELYRIESERSKLLATSQRLNNHDIRAMLANMQERG